MPFFKRKFKSRKPGSWKKIVKKAVVVAGIAGSGLLAHHSIKTSIPARFPIQLHEAVKLREGAVFPRFEFKGMLANFFRQKPDTTSRVPATKIFYPKDIKSKPDRSLTIPSNIRVFKNPLNIEFHEWVRKNKRKELVNFLNRTVKDSNRRIAFLNNPAFETDYLTHKEAQLLYDKIWKDYWQEFDKGYWKSHKFIQTFEQAKNLMKRQGFDTSNIETPAQLKSLMHKAGIDTSKVNFAPSKADTLRGNSSRQRQRKKSYHNRKVSRRTGKKRN